MSEKFNKNMIFRIIFAFLVATFLFIDLFAIAHSLSYINYQRTISQNNLINENLKIIDIYLNSSNYLFDKTILYEASTRLDDVGNRVILLELRFGKDDPRVLEQKKLYETLELAHLKIVNNLNEKANMKYTIITFFYSNSDVYHDESDKVGNILDVVKSEDPKKIMIYSFDYDLDFEPTNSLKTIKNITYPVSISIDENNYTRLDNIDQIESNLNNSFTP